MTDLDFSRELTPEEIERAKRAGKLAQDSLSGHRLYESLDIGEVLLKGRAIALARSGASTPRQGGRPYAEVFAAFKQTFGFPTYNDPKDQKRADAFYDDAIYCAQHRQFVDEIINKMDPRWRANVGVSGLAKRVRAKVREAQGYHPSPRVSPFANLKEQLAERDRELTKAKTDLQRAKVGAEIDYERDTPANIVRVMIGKLHKARDIHRLLGPAIKAEERRLSDAGKHGGKD